MILGNTLNGVSLCLERVLDHLSSRRAEVELRLAYGAALIAHLAACRVLSEEGHLRRM